MARARAGALAPTPCSTPRACTSSTWTVTTATRLVGDRRDRRGRRRLPRLRGGRGRPRPPGRIAAADAPCFGAVTVDPVAQAALAVPRAGLPGGDVQRAARPDRATGEADLPGGRVGDRRADARRHHRLRAGPPPRGRLAHPVGRDRGRGHPAAGRPGPAAGRQRPRRRRAHLATVPDRGRRPGGDRDGRPDPRRARPPARPAARRRPRPDRHRLRRLAQGPAGASSPPGSPRPPSTRSAATPTRSATSCPTRSRSSTRSTSSSSAPRSSTRSAAGSSRTPSAGAGTRTTRCTRSAACCAAAENTSPTSRSPS